MVHNTKIIKNKKSFIKRFLTLAIVCLSLYCVYSIIMQQSVYSQKKQERDKLIQQVEEAKLQREEYQRLQNMSNDPDYIERIAIEREGYAYPNEIRIYDTSKN